MSAPAISVLMSVHNDARFLDSAVKSIRAQSFTNFELLVMDDGSSDSSPAILARHAQQDPRIRIFTQDNRGLVVALNRLLGEARAPLVARMDADDIAQPDRFALQHSFLQDRKDVGCLGTHADLIDEDGQLLTRAPARGLTHDVIMADARRGIPVLHPSIMLRTDALRAIGGYRTPFRTAQDYDLYLRLAETTRLANLPETLLQYRVHAKQVSSSRLVQQTLSAVVAWHSAEARRCGRVDPVEALTVLPPIEALDILFDQPGITAEARARIVERMLFDPDLLAGDAQTILRDHIRETPARAPLWRAAARMARAGHIAPATRTLVALIGARL